MQAVVVEVFGDTLLEVLLVPAELAVVVLVCKDQVMVMQELQIQAVVDQEQLEDQVNPQLM
jgi:hypothetical protein